MRQVRSLGPEMEDDFAVNTQEQFRRQMERSVEMLEKAAAEAEEAVLARIQEHAGQHLARLARRARRVGADFFTGPSAIGCASSVMR